MANHLTPTELAREAGMDRREVISKCMEMGVPIFQGRIDKTLFLASLRESQGQEPQGLARAALEKGAAKAGKIARATMEEVRQKIGLYRP